MELTNKDISELLARRADETDEHRRRAYQRAARAALMWPEEAVALVEQDPLTELPQVGDRLAGRITSWIEDPPELEETPVSRQDFMTLAQARALLTGHPEWPSLRGDLQMHTVLSDGKASVAEMVESGIELGYEYIAITDHSKGLRIAGGADEAAFAAQSQEIDRVNEVVGNAAGFRVLKSMEMNIDVNGEGDMDAHVFDLFDVVLGSFHSQLRTTDDQTPRYLAALDNDDIQIIGHPRGRKFNNRSGLIADWRTILDAAADSGKALEINSYPDRQDLSLAILEQAGPDNVFSIGTDAHDPSEMHFFEYGLAQALAAGLEPRQIVNFWSADEVVEWAAGGG